MKSERKYGKPIVFKEHIGNIDILVTSRDPKTKVETFKEPKQKRRKSQPGKFGIMDYF